MAENRQGYSPGVEMRDLDFERISRLVYDLAGINLHDGKKELVKSRLGKRLRHGNFGSFSDYYRYVTTQAGADELIAMIDSLSTNLTYFFREEKHYKKLEEVVREIAKEQSQRTTTLRLRVWSAGCSTGEEPYTLALVLNEALAGRAGSITILATDISTRALKKAVTGIYEKERVNTISPPLLRKYFQLGQGRWQGHYRVKKNIREMISFKRFNLKETLDADYCFDFIFCRNVMIYFDKRTQEEVVNRFYDRLHEGGYLFIGHSESLTGLSHRFTYVQPSIYRK